MRCVSCYGETTDVNPRTDKLYVRCASCRCKNNEHNKTYRQRNPNAYRAVGRRNHYRLRLEVLTMYGNKCACCGESEEAFLALDHVKNDGSKHRKERGFYGVYKDALNYNPERFQVLCHNCNHAKYTRGSCPHSCVVH